MQSTFPNQIDNIPLFLDVTEKDGELLKQFEDFIQNNKFAEAKIILDKIENSKQKIITASKMNKLRNCIIKLEEFYKNDVESHILNQQKDWLNTINQFNFEGEYSSVKPYKINNIVSFREDGDYNLYLRINGDNLSNKSPIDKTYWRKFTVKGEQGISSNEETTFYFDWASNQTYAKNSIVSHNNKWWIALEQNIDSEPSDVNLNWELVMKSMQAIYPVQESQPLNQQNGELWFEVYYV